MKNNYWIDLQSKDHELLGVMTFFFHDYNHNNIVIEYDNCYKKMKS